MNELEELAFPTSHSWEFFKSNWRNCVLGALRYILRHPIGGWRVLLHRLLFALAKRSIPKHGVKTPEGFTLRTNSELLVYAQIFIEENLRHTPMLNEFRRRFNAVVIDVGANTGMVDRWLHSFNPTANFYCVEVMDENIQRMRAMDDEMEVPPWRVIHHRAAWNKIDIIPISVGEAVTTAKNHRERRSFYIRTTTVDSVAPDGTIFLLKIDTDGSNAKVLERAKATLHRTIWVLIEDEDGLDLGVLEDTHKLVASPSHCDRVYRNKFQ